MFSGRKSYEIERNYEKFMDKIKAKITNYIFYFNTAYFFRINDFSIELYHKYMVLFKTKAYYTYVFFINVDTYFAYIYYSEVVKEAL